MLSQNLLPKNENGAEYVLRQLKKLGALHLFMIPGKLINSFMRCYPKDDNTVFEKYPFPIVTACESGAAYMAEGYARVSQNFGICMVIGGPGVTNTLTGIVSAYMDGFPVFLLSGQISSSMEMHNVLQDSTQSGINQREIFGPVTKAAYEVKEGQPISRYLRESLRVMKGIECGPVYLSISKEVLNTYNVFNPDITKSVKESWCSRIIDINKIKSPVFKDFILHSKKCIILAGLRCKNIETASALIKFSEKYKFPVATTLSAKGLFPENHPLSLGVYGYSGSPRAINAFKDSQIEGVILLGMDTTQWSTMLWSTDLQPEGGTIHVDTNSDYLGKYLDVTCGITAHSSLFLDFISEYYNEALVNGCSDREEWIKNLMDTPRCYPIDYSVTGNPNDHPAFYISILQKFFPKNGVVSVDSGAHRSFFGHYWISNSPETYISATTLGPMGWSIPAGIGASFAVPERKCMVITGDGCMLMQGMEVATAKKYNCDILFVVFNNASYAASYFNNKDNRIDLTEIHDYNWSLFANSFGVDSICVRSPEELSNSLPEIIKTKGPFLIEIKCSGYHATPNREYNNNVKENKHI